MSRMFPLFPQAASTIATHVDAVTLALLISSGLILLLVFGLMAFFGIRYRKGSPYSRKIEWGGKHMLEWGWTVVTFFLFIGIFVWGAVVFFHIRTAPPGAMEVTVIGKQWMWKFQHPDGTRELDELHVPVGKPVVLKMISEDVIHSFFIPAFRVKQDVLPDRYTELWFQATKPGSYHLFCTQYCGTLHSGMRGEVIAMSPQDYERWVQTGRSGGAHDGALTMASRGRELFTRLGCISCHGNNPGVRAPNLAGLYGKEVGLSDGSKVLADENYIRESILNPSAKITQGYQNIMPSFAKTINDEDLLDLIAYIKSLRATPTGESP
jgi:cytochrome c oxidase subunit 2